MADHLTFALVAPIASFGGLAVGERRTGWDRPGRSAVLGLVGACLGLEREDDAAQHALATQYGLALLCHAPGRLLADYHTAQTAPSLRNRRFATRAEELAAPDLNTVLSRRDYRTGAWHLACLWPRSDTARWSLADLAAAMTHPVFIPYLGRKSCPLGLPLAPRIKEAADPTAALLERRRDGPEAGLLTSHSRTLCHALSGTSGPTPGTVMLTMDAADAADDPRVLRIERRRDQPRSRRRAWQFDLRDEAVLQVDAS